MATLDAAGGAYSLSVRLLRTTTEYAFVRVPVTDDLLVSQPDGTGRLDPTKVIERAIELGQASAVVWHPEGREVQPHPI
jgi:hypothetical protein